MHYVHVFFPVIALSALCHLLSSVQVVASEHACYNSVVTYQDQLMLLGLKVNCNAKIHSIHLSHKEQAWCHNV